MRADVKGKSEWLAYDWNNLDTHPTQVGRYLIYREKCDKVQFERWNGSGWAYSNGDCSHWMHIPARPIKNTDDVVAKVV
jgi:hypothetical protein